MRRDVENSPASLKAAASFREVLDARMKEQGMAQLKQSLKDVPDLNLEWTKDTTGTSNTVPNKTPGGKSTGRE